MHESWWYGWGGLNDQLFLTINHAGGGWLWTHLALLGTQLGEHALYPVYAALLLALALKKPNWLAVQSVLVLLCGYLIEAGIITLAKPWFDFPRPLKALGPAAVHVLGDPKLMHSFPSGHSAFAWLLAGALLPGAHWVLKVLLLVFALWVSWSRIAVGAHFPADVLGGALIGLFAAWLAATLLTLAGYARTRR